VGRLPSLPEPELAGGDLARQNARPEGLQSHVNGNARPRAAVVTAATHRVVATIHRIFSDVCY
jgi:hypothetical protein